MNKLCYSAFIVFCSSIATIMALGLMAEEPREMTGASPTSRLTLDAVAIHNTQEDCWMAIEGKVYDLTAYLDRHPTPPEILLPYCGTDATKGMRTKGYGNDHSQFAWGMLEKYHIGALE